MLPSPQVVVTKRGVVELSFHRMNLLDVVRQSWVLAKDDEVEPPCFAGENSQVTHRLLSFFSLAAPLVQALSERAES